MEYVVVAAVVAALFYVEKMRGVSGLNQLPPNLGGGAPLDNTAGAPTAPTATDQSASPGVTISAPGPSANPSAGPPIAQGAPTLSAPATASAPGVAPTSPQSPVLGLPPPPTVTLSASQAAPYIAPQKIDAMAFESTLIGTPTVPHTSFYPAITRE